MLNLTRKGPTSTSVVTEYGLDDLSVWLVPDVYHLPQHASHGRVKLLGVGTFRVGQLTNHLLNGTRLRAVQNILLYQPK